VSRFGSSRGVPDYDNFRTGLTYRQVRELCTGRKYRRRGTVLGMWNQLKREMFEQMTGIRIG
jgi:hypothetical protein